MDETGSESGSSATIEPQQTAPNGDRWTAFLRGARETPVLIALILSFSFVGFGALTKATGLSLFDTLFMSVFIFALPGQVVLVDQIGRGASMLTAAIAVTATAVRLLPMTVALLPVIRDRSGPKWLEFAASQFVAVTVWVEALRRAPTQPRPFRTAYTLGIGAFLAVTCSIGAVIGFLLAASVPKIFAAALLFLTPIYFTLSMIASSRSNIELLPIGVGLALGPLMHIALPQWDLLVTGLIGGTLSYFVARWWRGRGRA
jgi:predicted branched-subunit amino acid permease